MKFPGWLGSTFTWRFPAKASCMLWAGGWKRIQLKEGQTFHGCILFVGGGGQLYIDIWYNIMANLRYSLWTLDLLSLVGFFSSKCLHHRYLIQWYELSNADDFIPIPQNCGLHQVGRRVLHVYLVFYSATPMTHSTLLYLTGGSRTQRSPRTRQSLRD